MRRISGRLHKATPADALIVLVRGASADVQSEKKNVFALSLDELFLKWKGGRRIMSLKKKTGETAQEHKGAFRDEELRGSKHRFILFSPSRAVRQSTALQMKGRKRDFLSPR